MNRIARAERALYRTQVATLRQSGHTERDIMNRMQLSRGQVAHLYQEAQREGHTAGGQPPVFISEAGEQIRSPRNGRAESYGVTTYSYQTATPAHVLIPRYDAEPHIQGDCVLVGDVHAPTFDKKLATQVKTVGEALNIDTLLIVGDLINADCFSTYEHPLYPLPFTAEISAAEKLIADWAGHYQRILMVMGNHDKRLLKKLGGSFAADWLGRILDAGHGRFTVSAYSHIKITSGGEVFRATHQRNFSRIPGRVGNQLAQKFQCHMITFHEHHLAAMMDDYCRYSVINCPGLMEENQLGYTMDDNTSPRMAKGFCVLVNGTAHLITPYKAYTDLDVLLTGLAVRRAQQRTGQRKGNGR
jgi:hypothetical protein